MRQPAVVLMAVCILQVWTSPPAGAEPARLDPGIRVFDDVAPAPAEESNTARPWIEPALLRFPAKSSAQLDIIVELAARSAVSASRSEATDALERLESIQTRFASWSRSLGATHISGLSHFPLLNMRVPADRIARIAALPLVAAIYQNQPVYATRAEGGAIIGSPSLHAQYGAGGRGVGVAIFDSGIDAVHPELADSVVAGIDLAGGTDPFTDRDGHGTAVSGIVHGMAPESHLFAFKVLDDTGRGSDWSLAQGFNVAYANRTSFGGIHVINASLGSGGPVNRDCDRSHPSNRMIHALFRAGVVIVFASGNDGFLDGVSADACHSKVIAVGAVYDADVGPADFQVCSDGSTQAGQITCYSNSGHPLDVLAPSHNAFTTAPGGAYDATFGGTSAAAPYVAGVIAQLRSRLPRATPAKIRSALMSTGTPLRDINGITRRLIFGPAAYRRLGGR